jgi:uncharacterized protein (TIGR03435 family)
MTGKILVVGFVCAGMAMGQTAVPPTAVPTVAAKPISFEVASIRMSKAEYPSGYGYTRDGIDLKGFPPVFLISMGYQFNDFDRLAGLPGWCFSERYDIQAKVADADVAAWGKLDPGAKALALEALLADRFKLKVHRENKEGKVYELVVAKDGPKFKAAQPSAVDADAPPQQLHATVGGHETLDALARMLPNLGISRPVVNKTGLAGEYSLPLRLAPEADAAQTDPGHSDSSIIYALQEQLGLDLKLTDGQVEMLVIDHIERPSEN